MIGRLRSWVRRRRRAIALGDMGHAKLWYDPATDALWQAKTRWSVFIVPDTDDVDDAINMLEHVHFCELWVDPDDVLE